VLIASVIYILDLVQQARGSLERHLFCRCLRVRMYRPIDDAFEAVRLMAKHNPRMSKKMKWNVKDLALKVSNGY